MADSPNVIDSLKVVLELDPAKYVEGQKAAAKSFKETGDQAKKTAGELEESGTQGAEFFEKLSTAALKLGAIVVAGVGLNDLVKFGKESTASGNALHYMSKNIGISAQLLSHWQNMIKLTGGDAAQAEQSLLGISQALATIQIHGKGSGELLSAFRALGVDLVDPVTHKLKDVSAITEEVHAGLLRLAKTDPRLAYNMAAAVGYGDSFINVLMKEQTEYTKLNELSKQAGERTDEQANAASRLTTAWERFAIAAQQAGHNMMLHLDKPLGSFFNTLSDVTEPFNDEKWLKGAIPGYGDGEPKSDKRWFGGFRDWISSPSKPPAPEPAAPATAPKSTAGKPGSITIPMPLIPMEAPGINSITIHGGRTNLDLTQPTPPASVADQVFETIRKLEGGKVSSKTPTGKLKDPYAYGKNQITLGTALRYDKSATEKKLLDAVYNEQMFQKIKADLSQRYKDNPDALAIAYHNGPGAADRFIAQGGSTAGIPEWGKASQRYLEDERRLVQPSSMSTVNIQTINISTRATDADGIAKSIRQKLSNNQLINQANVGPQ